MVKDLVVIIQSRTRVQLLFETLKVLFSSCKSINNFDVYCLIDDDQVSLYEDLKKEFLDVNWKVVPRIENSWFSLLQAQQEIIEKNDYYFNWVITDDSIVNGLNVNWDENIIANKEIFKDGIFSLYTKSTFGNRDFEKFEICYHVNDNDVSNGHIILNCNEMLPICTKKWVELMWDIFKDGDFSSSRELITASLIYKLKKEYNINRHVNSNIMYGPMTAGPDEVSSSAMIKNKDGSTRDEAYLNLINNNFEQIMGTVNKIYSEIKNNNI